MQLFHAFASTDSPSMNLLCDCSLNFVLCSAFLSPVHQKVMNACEPMLKSEKI